jgi:hypothetical protein
VAFALVLVQILIMPEVLLVENYVTMSRLDLVDTVFAIGLPYMASAFGIFLPRQTFKQIPRDLDEAAQVEGAGFLRILLTVYVPLARPTYLAYGLVSELPLEQLPVAARDHQLARNPPHHRRPRHLRRPRDGRELVGRLRGDAAVGGAAAAGLPPVPASVRPELHARRHQVTRAAA